MYCDAIIDFPLHFPGSSRKTCVGFFIDGTQLGFVRPEVAANFQKFADVFEVVGSGQEAAGGRPAGVHLSQNLKTCEERSAAVNTVLEKLREQNELVTLRAWHDEVWKANLASSKTVLFAIETY